jgi:hypothetical protein
MSNRDYARRGVGCASEYPRAVNDLYTTNPIAITLLHDNGYLDSGRVYWECACGDGALSEELKRLGYTVVSTDLFDYDYGDKIGVDFLKCKGHFTGDIITNPPFKLLTEFILNGLSLTNRKLYIFSRLQTLESINRYEKIFKDNPPSYVLPFVKRVPCYKNGDKTKGSSVTPYAWYIWDKKDTSNKTLVEWLI